VGEQGHARGVPPSRPPGTVRGPSTSPDVEHVRIGGLRPRFVPYFPSHFLVVCSCDVHVRETDDRIGLRFGPRPGADPPVQHVQIITLPRPHACQMSMRREPHPVRPFSVRKNDHIDAQNGHAYHGRQTTLTNETRPAVLGSTSCERRG
jgi:hypothetical protein